MEVLNNIWMAISTPNEGLINLLSIPCLFIEYTLTMHLFLYLLKIEHTLKQKVIFVCTMSILSFISMNLASSPFNIIINYILTMILTYLIFKPSISKSIIAAIFPALTFGLIGFLVANPYITIMNITSEELNSIPIYRLIYIFIMYLICYFIVLIIKNQHLEINWFEDIDQETKIILIITFTLGIATFVLQSIITFYYIDSLPIIMTFLSFLSLLAYFGLSIYSLTRIIKLTLTTRKLQSAEEYNNTLRILHDNVRAFKHDFDNIVTTIGGFIKTNDMSGLQKYYLELEDDCQRVNNLYILNPEVVNNDGIYNLLTKKYYEADSKDIKVNITFLLDLSKLNMKIYEFARILGILLDNAIEASSECKEKIINLSFRDDSKNSRQLITIENTYNNKDVDTEKIFEKGVSGKDQHTGLGLWEVRKIIKKNTNLNLFTSKNKKLFIQQLEIYY